MRIIKAITAISMRGVELILKDGSGRRKAAKGELDGKALGTR